MGAAGPQGDCKLACPPSAIDQLQNVELPMCWHEVPLEPKVVVPIRVQELP